MGGEAGMKCKTVADGQEGVRGFRNGMKGLETERPVEAYKQRCVSEDGER